MMHDDKDQLKLVFKKRLYAFVLRLIRWIEHLPKDMVCQVLGKQLLRSSTSILANYVEATAASSRKEFINYFQYSLKSANESKVWLELLRDIQKGNTKELEWFLGEVDAVAKILAKSIVTLKQKQ